MWVIEYENDGNGGFEEWWNVVWDDERSPDWKAFRCFNEHNAIWLCDLLNSYQNYLHLLKEDDHG